MNSPSLETNLFLSPPLYTFSEKLLLKTLYFAFILGSFILSFFLSYLLFILGLFFREYYFISFLCLFLLRSFLGAFIFYILIARLNNMNVRIRIQKSF